MSVYAIGDVQGSYEELRRLIDSLRFDPSADKLWFVGDLVNRGPASLAVLRLLCSLGDSCVAILGNHDLHLLAVSEGHARLRPDDTLDELLAAPDRERDTMMDAKKLTTSVIKNNARPAAISADSPSAVDSP